MNLEIRYIIIKLIPYEEYGVGSSQPTGQKSTISCSIPCPFATISLITNNLYSRRIKYLPDAWYMFAVCCSKEPV